ncbi:MAG: arsenic transporter [Steroidobacteraceae bacterium]
MSPNVLVCILCGAALAGVIMRPLTLPEAVWPLLAGVLLVLLRLLSPADAVAGAAKGIDVYLFLAGMLLLSETARETGLFSWLAACAARHACGSATRLFLLIYAVGTVVTIFLSNDATAVVLTPAVAAVIGTAKVSRPLPYLLICAFVANAASFVLPISNPANLVIYGRLMPPLQQWLPRYLLPSLLSIVATYIALRFVQRHQLRGAISSDTPLPHLSPGGRVAAAGITATAAVLMIASAIGVPLGAPTAAAGLLTAGAVLVFERRNPWMSFRQVSWGVIPLVAGLFILVEALNRAGVTQLIGDWLRHRTDGSGESTAWISGLATAAVCNLLNNLPTGLIASSALHHSAAPDEVVRATLIGVDLGPNLSVTGSLATMLWLSALRREGLKVGAVQFLGLGLIVTPPALLLALAASILSG